MKEKRGFKNQGVTYVAFVRWCKGEGLMRGSLLVSQALACKYRLISLCQKLKNQ